MSNEIKFVKPGSHLPGFRQKDLMLILLVFAGLFLPFINKAFHIDDIYFLSFARMIEWNPLVVTAPILAVAAVLYPRVTSVHERVGRTPGYVAVATDQRRGCAGHRRADDVSLGVAIPLGHALVPHVRQPVDLEVRVV